MANPLSANDPKLTSWVTVPTGSDFPIQNIPFGVGNTAGTKSRAFTRIGDTAIDLRVLWKVGLIPEVDGQENASYMGRMNCVLRCGRPFVRALRQRLSELLRNEAAPEVREQVAKAFVPVAELIMDLPVDVGDYTDFYSSREHATNVGKMFRDPANALLPNWLHLPVGYHGRASSIVPSGVPVRRPNGQFKPDPNAPPVFGPTRQLDFELEVAFITCPGNALGERIPVERAEEHIFGLVLFNDWSARDIQAWEYVPLGPFLGKNFGSSMSPWVVTLDALEPFRVAGPEQDPEPLPYLRTIGPHSFDIALEVALTPEEGPETTICRSNFKHMYWSMAQQLAHHTVNGCNVRCGDVMASGTISGPEPGSYGSMLELSWRGTKPLTLADGSERKFIADGDTVIMRGHAERNGVRIGFGEVRAQVLPAT
ncbi:MAG: fumarylacetoacetase [Flavobacteriales bacterium]|nr:fumarylacetoacetase [Flavobacteriales bacterium]